MQVPESSNELFIGTCWSALLTIDWLGREQQFTVVIVILMEKDGFCVMEAKKGAANCVTTLTMVDSALKVMQNSRIIFLSQKHLHSIPSFKFH